MKNVFREEASSLISCLGGCRSRGLFPPMGDPRWKRAFSSSPLRALRAGLLREDAAAPLPELTDELYRDYHRTGVRKNFEDAYFARRRRLVHGAAVLLMQGDDRTAPATASFLVGLDAIAREPSWALPAHVLSPDGRDPSMIDLFAAQTSLLLAELLDIFEEIVPGVLRAFVVARVRQDLLRNYVENADRFFWTRITNNWNAVCHQGIVGAALILEDDPSLVARVVDTMNRHLPRYLDGFARDGGCTEGPTYWDYGFGAYSLLNEQVEKHTGGALSLFHDDPRIERIARYGPAISLQGGGTICFSDSHPHASLRPTVLGYLGERLADASCLRQRDTNYAALSGKGLDGESVTQGEILTFTYLLRLFLDCPEIPQTQDAASGSDALFQDLGIWIARGRDKSGHLWECAAKAGHNDEHHNHDDLGSFSLHIDGVPLLLDLGRPEYTRDYFTPKHRYASFPARSLGHGVPLINGLEQGHGGKFCATIPASRLSGLSAYCEIDLTHAYPGEARCRRLVRTLFLDKLQGSLTWTDEFRLDEPAPIESALILDSKPQLLTPRLAVLTKGGLRLKLHAHDHAEWQRVDIHEYRGYHSQVLQAFRLILIPSVKGPSFKLGAQIEAECA